MSRLRRSMEPAVTGWRSVSVGHVSTGGAVIFTSHQPSRFSELQQDLDLAHYARPLIAQSLFAQRPSAANSVGMVRH